MPEWPADKVERWPLERLTPYARNARQHSDEQVAQIEASIREFGWTVPVLVDETGGIIAGHGRVMAAQRMGLPDAPVMVARGWSDAQKRAYVLADNQIALNASWDQALLNAELGDLAGLGFDMAAFGFDEPGDGEAEGTAEIEDVGTVERFWIAVSGPLTAQAEALHALKELAKLPGVEVDSNLVG